MKPLYRRLVDVPYIKVRDLTTPFYVSWYMSDTIVREIRNHVSVMSVYFVMRDELGRTIRDEASNK